MLEMPDIFGCYVCVCVCVCACVCVCVCGSNLADQILIGVQSICWGQPM